MAASAILDYWNVNKFRLDELFGWNFELQTGHKGNGKFIRHAKFWKIQDGGGTILDLLKS